MTQRLGYLFSGYRFPKAGAGAVVWRGPGLEGLEPPSPFKHANLEARKRGLGVQEKKKKTGKMEKMEKKMDDSALVRRCDSKEATGSADLEVKLLIGFILLRCPDSQMPKMPKNAQMIRWHCRIVEPGKTPSRRGYPDPSWTLSHTHLPPSPVPSARAAVMHRLDGYDLMMTMG